MHVALLCAVGVIAVARAATLDAVPRHASRRIATIEGTSGEIDVLVLRGHPTPEVQRWSPRTGERSWSWRSDSRREATGAGALTSIADQDGDGWEDWVLAHTERRATSRSFDAVLTIGCGRTGRSLRTGRVEDVGPHVTIARVNAPHSAADLVLGCPTSGDPRASETGIVAWLRSADLAVAALTLAPPGEREFGAYVGSPFDADAAVWIGATQGDAVWRVWSATSSAPNEPRVVLDGTRPVEREEPHARRIHYGSWLAVSTAPASIASRACVVGAPGRPTEGRVVYGRLGSWPIARTVVGPAGLFGTHFGAVVHLLDDRDGDGLPEILATDPGLHVGNDDSKLFAGGLYVVCSSDGTAQLLGTGGSAMTFLGIGMLPVDDVDGGGAPDVAVLASPQGEYEPYFEVWSAERLSLVWRVRCTAP